MSRRCTVVASASKRPPHPDFETGSFVEFTGGALAGHQGVVRGQNSRGDVLVETGAHGEIPVQARLLKTITEADTRAALNRGALQRAIKGGHFDA